MAARAGRVEWWQPMPGRQNFGDFLSKLFLAELFEEGPIPPGVHHLVGSVISEPRIRQSMGRWPSLYARRVVFWGCGCRDEQPLSPASLRHSAFHGVRGPLTREVLRLPATTPLGDPGLLLPLVFNPGGAARSRGRRVVVPHVWDVVRRPDDFCAASGADMLLAPLLPDSLDALKDLLNEIAQAQFVLTGSLHAAIVACAYGVPFCFYDSGRVDVPFKWRDFAALLGIPCVFVRSVEEGLIAYDSLIGPRLRRPSLLPLLEAAPLRVKDGVLAAARRLGAAPGAAIP